MLRARINVAGKTPYSQFLCARQPVIMALAPSRHRAHTILQHVQLDPRTLQNRVLQISDVQHTKTISWFGDWNHLIRLAPLADSNTLVS